jgi:hypothetical protein
MKHSVPCQIKNKKEVTPVCEEIITKFIESVPYTINMLNDKIKAHKILECDNILSYSIHENNKTIVNELNELMNILYKIRDSCEDVLYYVNNLIAKEACNNINEPCNSAKVYTNTLLVILLENLKTMDDQIYKICMYIKNKYNPKFISKINPIHNFFVDKNMHQDEKIFMKRLISFLSNLYDAYNSYTENMEYVEKSYFA